jgi:hypothetical protein
MRWESYVASMEKKRNINRILAVKKERDNFKELGVGGNIILKRTLNT